MPLPHFKYHPDPIATGSVEVSEAVCDCCGQNRGYIYIASFYSSLGHPQICPWCIASGEAAARYKGAFNDSHPIGALSDEIIREVCERTPGYNSWQQEEWQSHCNDACEFHGDAKKNELRELKPEEVRQLLERNSFSALDWKEFMKNYEPGGSPAIYKFVCRHCRQIVYGMDCH